MTKRITEMWAWLCIDPDSGDEGIPAVYDSGVMLPLVGSSKNRMSALQAKAQAIATVSGQSVRLVRFHTMEVVKELKP